MAGCSLVVKEKSPEEKIEAVGGRKLVRREWVTKRRTNTGGDGGLLGRFVSSRRGRERKKKL